MKPFLAICLSLSVLACTPGAKAPAGAGTGGPQSSEKHASETHAPATSNNEDAGAADAGPTFATGQALYVPVYSHVYYGPGQRHFNLACTLSVRNIDTDSPITLIAVDYYNTTGELVRPFVDGPRTLAPLETLDFYIQERDTTGGSGANFIVRWGSNTEVNAPIVEAVMIGVAEGQGISFVSPSREITE